MQVLCKTPLPANTWYLVLVWCKHVTGKIQHKSWSTAQKITLQGISTEHRVPDYLAKTIMNHQNFVGAITKITTQLLPKNVTKLTQFHTIFNIIVRTSVWNTWVLISAFLWALPVIFQLTPKIIHWISSHISRLPLYFHFASSNFWRHAEKQLQMVN